MKTHTESVEIEGLQIILPPAADHPEANKTDYAILLSGVYSPTCVSTRGVEGRIISTIHNRAMNSGTEGKLI